MSVEYVNEFPKLHKDPVRITLDHTDVDVSFADGELNTLGTFQADGTLRVHALGEEFAERLEAAGFTLESFRGEKFLKVVK